jgi:parallel beta-helix repeat protein
VSSPENTLAGNHVTGSISYAILLCPPESGEGPSNNTITGNSLVNNLYGITLSYSSNNFVSENIVMSSNDTAVRIEHSHDNILTGNNITANYERGIWTYSSSDNLIYHNNLVNNSGQQVASSNSNNTWDEGYPSGGNYWSNYNGTDLSRGPYQNETGIDGIGDAPYIIDSNNRDNYPLMQPWIARSTQYQWPMFRQNLMRTGYTESPAPKTSQKKWGYTTGSFVESSPAVVDGKVYVGSWDNNTYCLDALTGTRIWNYTTGNHVVASSPAVVDGRVYVGSEDRNLYCLDALTGTRIWNYTTGNYVYSSPAVVDGRVYVGSGDGKVYCLDALTGTRIWNYTTGTYVESSPAVVDGRVYIGSDDYNVYCLDALTGTRIWNYTTGNPVRSCPAVVDGRVYVGSIDCNVYCLDALTGTRIWSYLTGIPGIRSSPAVADGRVYVGSLDHNIYCLDALTGTSIWNYTTGMAVLSSPAIADGEVYIGSCDNKTYCLDASTGAQIWNYTTGNWVTSSPAIADGMLFIGSYDGAVYAIGDVVRVPEDYPTIQAAINAASPGDTVMVAPGVYHECLTINKPLTLLGERGSDTTFEGGGSGIAITLLPGASGTIIAGVVITNYNQGILVVNANNCKIYDTIMSLSSNGIALQGSNAANNNIYSNIFQNNAVAVNLTASSTSNTFYKNIIISNVRAGINLQSDGNIIYANTISGNPCGINVTASNNLIYHNNFIDNTVQASVTSSGNMWNDSYPSGGNYWSDYAGVDNYRGPSQTLPGSDSIGDTGYTIAVNNMDRYPLMKPFNPHDIGITGLYTSKTVVGQGYCMNMILRILNYGMYDEAFAVRCYANTTIMANQPFALTSKNSTAITLTWNTTGFVKGNYTLSAYAWPVQGETDTSDNTLTDGLVYVGVPGDVDGNHKVEIKDILIVAKAYGTNPQSPNWNPNADVNCDDKVDIKDILITAKNYGKTDP